MEKICDVVKCTSCKACINICPKDAIEVVLNDMGQMVPSINQEKCVNCGLCLSICPVNKPVTLNNITKCYAAWTKDVEDKMYSSSGGVASAFAKEFSQKGGKVFGASFTTYNNELRLDIKMADSDKDLRAFRGSKYVQSDVGYTYREVKQCLEAGKEVLYIAMPCQIAGLKSFLKKEYDRLYTVDIICHGMPPIQYLQEHIESISKNNRVNNLLFRGKYDFELALFKKGIEKPFYKKKSREDTYFISFLEGLIYKKSCYRCEYAQPNRTGDITIGDFWGLNKNSLKEPYKGRISVVLVNTNKGKRLLDMCSNRMYLEERKVHEAVEGNAQLRKPSVCHPKRMEFEDAYGKYGFTGAMSAIGIYRTVRYNRIINILKTPFRPIKRIFFSLLKD